MAKILVVDDDLDLLDVTILDVRSHTSERGQIHQIDGASDGNEAIASLQKSVPDGLYNILLTDYEMGDGPDGVDVIEEAVRLGVAKIFIITAVEYDGLSQKIPPLNQRLRDAVQRHRSVSYLLKGNYDSFVRNVYAHLDGLSSAR